MGAIIIIILFIIVTVITLDGQTQDDLKNGKDIYGGEA